MKLVTTQSDMRVEGGLHVGLLCVRLDTIVKYLHVKYLQTLTSASETNLSGFLWRSTCGHMSSCLRSRDTVVKYLQAITLASDDSPS